MAEGETIICLGDVTVDGKALAHQQEWWRKAPGAKWRVLGNHDVDPVNQVRPFEIDRTAVTLYAAGDPPLLLTHVPLLQVPHGAVNVHGHVHEQESPTPNRHVNVSVEQLNYRPARLSEIRRLARRLLERRTRPGTQHPDAAERRRTRDAVRERHWQYPICPQSAKSAPNTTRQRDRLADRTAIGDAMGIVDTGTVALARGCRAPSMAGPRVGRKATHATASDAPCCPAKLRRAEREGACPPERGYVIVVLMSAPNTLSLVGELQREVVDSSVPISDILRKAKILASLLNNQEFKRWIHAELSGYGTSDRPNYRKFRLISFGVFVGPAGGMAKNIQIPAALLPGSLRQVAEHLETPQGMKEIETLAVQAGEDGAIRMSWPPEAVILAREHLAMDNGYELAEAWKPLVKSQLDGILDQVRNRLLDFLLELQQVNPDVVDSEAAIRAVPQHTIENLFQTIIYGGKNTVATGVGFAQLATAEAVTSGDIDSLVAHLRGVGLDETALGDVAKAIAQDGDRHSNQFGSHVKTWFGRMVTKAMDGTWKVALSTAPRILQEALLRYYDWK